MNSLIAAPVVIPLLAACLCLTAWSRPQLQRGIVGIASLGSLVVALALLSQVLQSGSQVLAVGGWRAPFGIQLHADLTSALLVTLTAIVGAIIVLDARTSSGPLRDSYGFQPILQVLFMGVNGAFLTADLFNLFVWFEVLLISSFVLLALGAGRLQLDAALKYVALNLVASAIFLAGLGLLYGTIGTLNMADIAMRFGRGEGRGMELPLAMMFFTAFGMKAGLVPFHSWLPTTYSSALPPVGALFAGLLTKVGLYSLLRTSSLIFRGDPEFTHGILLVLASATMLVGAVGALGQADPRRILSFSVLNGVGGMAMGIAIGSPIGYAAALLSLLHSGLALVAVFLITASLEASEGPTPLLRNLWLLVGLSLVGVPPFGGFFGKLALAQAGLASGHGFVVAVLLLSSAILLAAFLRGWGVMMANAPSPSPHRPLRPALLVAVMLVAGLPVVVGPLSSVCFRAGREVALPENEIARLLGGR